MLTFADANTTDVANGSPSIRILLLLLDRVFGFWRANSVVLLSSRASDPCSHRLTRADRGPGVIVAWLRGENSWPISGAFSLCYCRLS